MILKSLSRSRADYRNLLQYIFRESDSKGKNAFILQKNISGKSLDEWVQCFHQNEKTRLHHRNNNNKIFHEIISFARSDSPHITATTMKAIGKKYLQLRGDNIMAIGAMHQNKHHVHLHLCISPVELYTGRSLRISKDKFREIKNELQNYHLREFPEIQFSTVKHGHQRTKNTSEQEYQLKKRTGQSERVDTARLLEEIYNKASSREDFYRRISQNGLKLYQRNGQPYGIQGKRKMRFTTLDFGNDRMELLDEFSEFDRLRNADASRTRSEMKSR
jgi:hypothetical protein